MVRRPLIVFLALAATTLVGCGIVPFFATALAPPRKVPPAVEFPEGARVLVFVDDVGHRGTYAQTARLLSERINDQLVRHVPVEVIPYAAVERLRAQTSGFGGRDPMSIDRIGQGVGAEFVIYVKVDQLKLRELPEGPYWQGELRTLVRVVRSGDQPARLWPEGGSPGWPQSAQTPLTENASPAYGHTVAAELVNELGTKIAKLFYEHEIPRM